MTLLVVLLLAQPSLTPPLAPAYNRADSSLGIFGASKVTQKLLESRDAALRASL